MTHQRAAASVLQPCTKFARTPDRTHSHDDAANLHTQAVAGTRQHLASARRTLCPQNESTRAPCTSSSSSRCRSSSAHSVKVFFITDKNVTQGSLFTDVKHLPAVPGALDENRLDVSRAERARAVRHSLPNQVANAEKTAQKKRKIKKHGHVRRFVYSTKRV